MDHCLARFPKRGKSWKEIHFGPIRPLKFELVFWVLCIGDKNRPFLSLVKFLHGPVAYHGSLTVRRDPVACHGSLALPCFRDPCLWEQTLTPQVVVEVAYDDLQETRSSLRYFLEKFFRSKFFLI